VERTAIETLAALLDEACRGDPEHSLLANLASVHDEEWTSLPAGAQRSIADVAEHVGWAKHMYADYAFGAASLDGRTLAPPADDRSAMLAWIEDGHRTLVAGVRALEDDAELDRDRLANWGEMLPTRRLIWIMIAHDTYHAGEINRQRALLRGDDRWAYLDG
jgi:uncharacterized damage-inducible protein DinB